MICPFKDIAVTGFASVSAAGNSVTQITGLIATGGTALSPVPDGIRGGDGHLWGKALGFKATDFIPPLKARKMDRCSQFAVAAAGMALKDSGLVPASLKPERVGIALGCGFGGVANSVEFMSGYFTAGVDGLSPMLFPNTVSNAPASNASIEHGLKGPNVTLVQRFCSAESALMMACSFIAEGRADVMLTGGADDLMPLMISGFSDTGQLRRYASSFGEGCGLLVLESADHARQRGAAVRASLSTVSTIGLLVPGQEEDGIERLLPDVDGCSLISLSGTVSECPSIMRRISGLPTLDISAAVGRSLAMGGTAMAALVSSLTPGRQGLHLAASPEGPYYAIRFSGNSPVQS